MVAGLTTAVVVLVIVLAAAAYFAVRMIRRACDDEIMRLKASHAEELERILASHREQQHQSAALLSAAQTQMRFQQQPAPPTPARARSSEPGDAARDPVGWFKRMQKADAEAERMRASMGPDSYLLEGAPMIAPSNSSSNGANS